MLNSPVMLPASMPHDSKTPAGQCCHGKIPWDRLLRILQSERQQQET